MPGVRRRTKRPREVSSRKHEEKLRAANPQIKKADAGACHAWCGSARRRFGSKHPRHSTWRQGREVAWSATENDAAAGEF